MKEAFIKAIGVGLSCDLQQININLFDKQAACSIGILDNLKEAHWKLQTFSPFTNYYAAFAIKKILMKVTYLNFEHPKVIKTY